MFKNIYLS